MRREIAVRWMGRTLVASALAGVAFAGGTAAIGAVSGVSPFAVFDPHPRASVELTVASSRSLVTANTNPTLIGELVRAANLVSRPLREARAPQRAAHATVMPATKPKTRASIPATPKTAAKPAVKVRASATPRATPKATVRATVKASPKPALTPRPTLSASVKSRPLTTLRATPSVSAIVKHGKGKALGLVKREEDLQDD